MRLVREDADGLGGFAYVVEYASEADLQEGIPTGVGAVQRMRGHLTEQWGGGTFYHDPASSARGDSFLCIWVSRDALDLLLDGCASQVDADDRWRALLISANLAGFRIGNCGCTLYEEDPQSRWQDADHYSPDPIEGEDELVHTQWKSWFEHKWRSGGETRSRRLRIYATDMCGRGTIEYAVDLLRESEGHCSAGTRAAD